MKTNDGESENCISRAMGRKEIYERVCVGVSLGCDPKTSFKLFSNTLNKYNGDRRRSRERKKVKEEDEKNTKGWR